MPAIVRCVVMVLCLIFVMTGCNRGPKVLPISGTVNYDGQPVSNAIITLVPNGSGGKPTQAGVMDGKFKLASKFGVVSGTYNITVEEAISGEGMISDVEPEEGSVAPQQNIQSTKRLGYRPYSFNHTFPENEKKEYVLEINIPKK